MKDLVPLHSGSLQLFFEINGSPCRCSRLRTSLLLQYNGQLNFKKKIHITMRLSPFFHALFIFSGVHVASTLSLDLLSDCDALVSTTWTVAWWNTSSSLCCNWPGVRCTGADGKISSLYVSNAGLTGSIPFSLSKLTSLTYLDLSNNRLSAGMEVLGTLTRYADSRLRRSPNDLSIQLLIFVTFLLAQVDVFRFEQKQLSRPVNSPSLLSSHSSHDIKIIFVTCQWHYWCTCVLFPVTVLGFII